MIKHIVLWKLDNSYLPAEKEKIRHLMRKKLLKLEQTITLLLHIEVYFNNDEASGNNYDIVLDTVFNSMDDLAIYQAHPDHLKVAEYIKTLKLQRAAIDFSF
jgi:hypothetical protein